MHEAHVAVTHPANSSASKKKKSMKVKLLLWVNLKHKTHSMLNVNVWFLSLMFW